MPKTMVINSPGFTTWGEHFARLLGMVDQAEGSLMTILGINRMSSPQAWLNDADEEADQSFSDFPILMPTGPSAALSQLATIHLLSITFLKGTLASAPCLEGKKPDRGKYKRGEDGKMQGKDGEVALHLLAQQ